MQAKSYQWANQKVRESGSEFLNRYRQLCIELGGDQWDNKECSELLRSVQQRLREEYVIAGKLKLTTYYRYCLLARKCLILGIDWRQAQTTRTTGEPMGLTKMEELK